MIFEGAGKVTRSRHVQAKDGPALTLISRLVQPHGCNPEAKRNGADQGQRSTGSEGNYEKEEKNLLRRDFVY